MGIRQVSSEGPKESLNSFSCFPAFTNVLLHHSELDQGGDTGHVPVTGPSWERRGSREGRLPPSRAGSLENGAEHIPGVAQRRR